MGTQAPRSLRARGPDVSAGASSAGRPLTPRGPRTLRLLGWLLLVGAVIPGVIELGPSVGIALWAAVLSVAAGGLVVLLTYRPRLIVPLAVAGPSMALAVWVF